MNDRVLDDVYERLKISNATSKFIKKVATDMVTTEESHIRRVLRTITCDCT